MGQGWSEELIARMADYHDRMEAAEKRGAKDLAEAFASPPPGLSAHEIDDEMRVLRANDADLRLLGVSREEFVGQRVLDFIVMTETAGRAIGRKITGEQELKPFVRTFKRKDGKAIPLVLLDRYLRDAAGKVIGLRTVLAPTDV
jgi:PAS domain S-box-containing protein